MTTERMTTEHIPHPQEAAILREWPGARVVGADMHTITIQTFAGRIRLNARSLRPVGGDSPGRSWGRDERWDEWG